MTRSTNYTIVEMEDSVSNKIFAVSSLSAQAQEQNSKGFILTCWPFYAMLVTPDTRTT